MHAWRFVAFARGVVLSFVLFLLLSDFGIPAQAQDRSKEACGEIFGLVVPCNNYLFVRSVIAVFGNRWGEQPKNLEEFEDLVWEELVLSYEAYRRNIFSSPQQVNEEIARVLKAQKVNFDYQKDKAAYKKWVEKKTNGPVEFFENQVKHILQIGELRRQVMNSFDPGVSEGEAKEAFLGEHTLFDLEAIRFPSKDEGSEILRKAKDDNTAWEGEKKKRLVDFGAFTQAPLHFIQGKWQLPREVTAELSKIQPVDFYLATLSGEGCVVFKVLRKLPADESEYSALRSSYFEKLKAEKRSGLFKEWLKGLKQKASVRIFKKGGLG